MPGLSGAKRNAGRFFVPDFAYQNYVGVLS
jgi:hypothetical protein